MLETDTADVDQRVSTGALPSGERVGDRIRVAYEHALYDRSGEVADYIPELASADPELFGVCVADVTGSTSVIGDADVEFTIQSISKAFVYALVCNAYGHSEVGRLVGVNNSGLAFNSVIAIELNDGHPMNPMVNAGAIATTALMPGGTHAEKWENIRTGLSAFAGRQLSMDGSVYASEAATNTRNEAIAKLLKSYGRLGGDSSGIVDVYTRQCSLRVSVRGQKATAHLSRSLGLNVFASDNEGDRHDV